MGLFSKRQNTPDLLASGRFVCSECNKLLDLAGYTPLVAGQCEHCHKVNFIPKKDGDFFLVAPLGGGGMGSVYKSVRLNSTDEFAVNINGTPTHTGNDPHISQGMMVFPGPGNIQPIQTPLVVSGIDSRVLAFMEEKLAPYAMLPLQGGSATQAMLQEYSPELEPGAAIGIQLIRGDMNASGIGTNGVLAK